MPKVSFVVAVYKVADYVERCMRSLFEQTLDDIEIVVVDDCTPDDSVAVIERVAADYPHRKGQFRIVSHEHNMGLPQTRKTGLYAATGEYIFFVDGDDYVEPQMADLMYGKATETGADMVLCDIYWQKEDGREYYAKHVPDGMPMEAVRDAIINRQIFAQVWCKLFRRALFVDNEVAWPLKGYAEDCVVSPAAAYYARTVAYVPRQLYHYVYRPGSYIHNKSRENILKNFEEHKANLQVLEDFFERNGAFPKYGQGVFVGKVRCKNLLLPLVGSGEYRRLFRDTYPEVNRSFLWGDGIRCPSFRERIWMAAILLGFYPPLKRVLESKRLRPREGWK